MLEGYKVVKFISGFYYSIFSSKQVEYSLDYKTHRPDNCGPLALFDSIQSVKQFLLNNTMFTVPYIYKCQYKESTDRRLWHSTYCGKIMYYTYTPIGTVFADWIMPTEYISTIKE